MHNQVENTVGVNIKPVFNGNISETFYKTDTNYIKRNDGFNITP